MNENNIDNKDNKENKESETESRQNKRSIKQALYKKAVGYNTKEIVEEYIADEIGDIRLSKKKVTIKSVPPDISAMKLIIEEKEKREEKKSVYDMTDEQLETEKERLLKIFYEKEKEQK